MAYPHANLSAAGRADAEVRRPSAAAPARYAAQPESEIPMAVPAEAGPAEAAVEPSDEGRAADLVELGRQFAGLTRLLDEITAVGKGLPRADVDSMLKPVFGVLRGVMNRIVGAPAATVAELGIKAQVVMWSHRDWWDADAKLGWQDTATKAFLEQTIAAAGLTPPRAPRHRTEIQDGAA